MPHDFDPIDRPAIKATLAAASYLAVRDRFSAGLLGLGTNHVVPDTALGLAELWPLTSLQPDFQALLARLAPVPPGPYVAVHVKERSLDEPLSQLAVRLKDFRATTGRTPILIGIGQCHGDDVIAATLARDLAGQCIDMSQPLGLREIAAAIGFSDGYIGASLHGYITAASYGRHGVIVGKPPLPKMQGLLSQIGRETDEVDGWQAALDQMAGRIDLARPKVPAAAFTALTAHWQAVATALTSRPSQMVGQNQMALQT